MRPHRSVAVLTLALVAAACSASSSDVTLGSATPYPGGSSTTAPNGPTTSTSGSSTTAGGSATTAAPAGSLSWQSCGKDVQCAHLTVPLDWSDSSKGTIDLFVKKHPAVKPKERIGSLLFNPGGPGVEATPYLDQASSFFSQNLLDRFDIVTWDPRGTGQSSPVDCVDNLDPYVSVDPTPDTPADQQALADLSKQFADACQQRSGRLLPYVSTQDTARDMDALRAALGDEKASYIGFSYGSELGATYATMFPTHVRALTLDGAVNPNAGYAESTKETVVGLEMGLKNMLDDCAKKSSCKFNHGGDPYTAYDALMKQLDDHPLAVAGATGRPPVNQGVADYAVLWGLYLQELWPYVTSALAAAENGDGSQLLDLYDEYLKRQPDGSWSNEIEDLTAIDCLDNPGPKSQAENQQLGDQLRPLAPHWADWATSSDLCLDWPVPQKPPIKITGAGAGPIVVVGTTGDPITPLESTKAMANALEHGVLVTVQADQHTGYGVNDCVTKAVDDYLVNLTVPAAGLVCR